MKECEFCRQYLFRKKLHRMFRKEHPQVKYGFSVAMVDHAWTYTKKNASRTTDYRHLGIGYDLNFCPECGRKLNRRIVKSVFGRFNTQIEASSHASE